MRLRVHHQWILRGLGGEELRVQPFDAPRPPRWVLLPPMFPMGYLDRWLSEPDARRTLVEIHETLFGRLTLPVWSDDEIALAIRPRLITALDRKDLVVLTPLRANAPRPVPDPVPIIPPRKEEPKKEEETTWVEIELYEGPDPVAGEDFVVTPASGSPISGKLDTDGFKHVDGIPAGICKVEFPNIDAREWSMRVLASKDPPEPEGELVRSEPDEDYEVRKGDDLFTIAKLKGFRNWQTIHRYEANASLRALRPNPGLLFPGDSLVLPGRRTKRETVGTGRTHRFYVHPPTRRLRLRLRDTAGNPLAAEPYELSIDGAVVSTEATDAGGEINEEISVSAKTGSLTTKVFSWPLEIGALNPMKQTLDNGVSGAQARLKNLGYDPGPVDGILGPRTSGAISRFQRDTKGLSVTGKLDAATIAAITAEHGC